MKNAQIDIRQPIKVVTSWTASGAPVETEIPASARIVDVEDVTYPVGSPLFWIECADEVTADNWYYDEVSQSCVVIPAPAPKPATSN